MFHLRLFFIYRPGRPRWSLGVSRGLERGSTHRFPEFKSVPVKLIQLQGWERLEISQSEHVKIAVHSGKQLFGEILSRFREPERMRITISTKPVILSKKGSMKPHLCARDGEEDRFSKKPAIALNTGKSISLSRQKLETPFGREKRNLTSKCQYEKIIKFTEN